jgi:hypothetical protein
MVQSTEEGDRTDQRFSFAAQRCVAIQSLVRPMDMIVFKVLRKDAAEMA